MPTVQQLRKLAKARKVPKYSSMTKPQLLGALGMHDDLKAHKLSQGQTKAVSANAKNIAKGNATTRAIVEGRLKRAVARDLNAAKKGGKELSQEEKRAIALKAVAREAKAIKAGQKEEKPKRGGDAASRILSKLKSGEAVHYTGLDGHEYEAKYERNDDLGVASLSIGRPGDRRPRRQPIMHDRDLHQFASDLVNPKLNQIASQAKAIKAGQKEENPERGGVQKKQAIEGSTYPASHFKVQALFNENKQIQEQQNHAAAKVVADYADRIKESKKRIERAVNDRLTVRDISAARLDEIDKIHATDPEVKRLVKQHDDLMKEHTQKGREAKKPFREKIARNMHTIADLTGDASYRHGHELKSEPSKARFELKGHEELEKMTPEQKSAYHKSFREYMSSDQFKQEQAELRAKHKAFSREARKKANRK